MGPERRLEIYSGMAPQILTPNRRSTKRKARTSRLQTEGGPSEPETPCHGTEEAYAEPTLLAMPDTNTTQGGLVAGLQAPPMIARMKQPEIPLMAPESNACKGAALAVGGYNVPDVTVPLHHQEKGGRASVGKTCKLEKDFQGTSALCHPRPDEVG